MITRLTAMDRLASNERKDRLLRSRIKTRRIMNGRKHSIYMRKSVLLFSEELLVVLTFMGVVLFSKNPSWTCRKKPKQNVLSGGSTEYMVTSVFFYRKFFPSALPAECQAFGDPCTLGAEGKTRHF